MEILIIFVGIIFGVIGLSSWILNFAYQKNKNKRLESSAFKFTIADTLLVILLWRLF